MTDGAWKASGPLNVNPRLRVSPTSADQGAQVSINLTGFHAKEVVTLKWKKGSTWVTVANTTVSSQGTRNKTVTVPSWAPAGTSTIRGIGAAGSDARTIGLTVTEMGTTATVPAATVPGSPQQTPVPTPTVEPSATLDPAPTIELTVTPDLTPSPAPDPTLVPTEPPVATSTVEPVPTSEPLVTPDPGLDPTPDATPDA